MTSTRAEPEAEDTEEAQPDERKFNYRKALPYETWARLERIWNKRRHPHAELPARDLPVLLEDHALASLLMTGHLPMGEVEQDEAPITTDTIVGQVEAEARRLLIGDADAADMTRSQGALLYAYLRKHGLRMVEERLAKLRQLTIDPDKSVGVRTLADLPTGAIPDQLLPPFLSPEGPTILYGPGGVGKGMLSVYWALSLVRLGHVVMVIDYEHNEHEWGRRARAMGATDEELARIHYRAPFADDWTATRGALIEVAPYLRADCDRLGVDFVIVDSFVMATTTGDSMGGQAATQEFYTGIKTIGRCCLVLAHVTGNAARFPTRPFGSVYVHNLARETWATEAIDTEAIEFDPATHAYQPTVLALELRNRKMNNGPSPENQFISFSFFPDGHIEVDSVKPKKGSIADWAVDVLTRAKNPLATAALIKAIDEDRDEKVQSDSLRKALRRDKRVRRTDDEPALWTLRESHGEDD